MPRRAFVPCVVVAFLGLAALMRCAPDDAPPDPAISAAANGGEPPVEVVAEAVERSRVQRIAATAELRAAGTPPTPIWFEPPVARAALDSLAGLYVRVASGGQVLPGQVVQLLPRTSEREQAGWFAAAPGSTAAGRVAITDGAGFAAFPGDLPHGAVVGVEWAGSVVRRTIGPTRLALERIDIEIGPAGVDGVVYGANGALCRGALVRASAHADREVVTAFSDANGRFALRGLPAAIVDVWCQWPDAQRTERCQVPASAERPAFVRFGAVPGSGWWRGCVVDTDGGEVLGCSSLVFEQPMSGELRSASTAVDGSFAVCLPPGRWRGRRSTAGMPDPTMVTEVDIEARAEHHEGIVAPGHRVMLRLQPAHAGVDVPSAERSLVLRCDGQCAANRRPIEWNGSWYMVWNGLAAGVYRLCSVNGGLCCVGEPDGGFTLDLTGPGALVQFEVVLAQRGRTR